MTYHGMCRVPQGDERRAIKERLQETKRVSSQQATSSLVLFCHPCKAVINTSGCPLHLIGTTKAMTKKWPYDLSWDVCSSRGRATGDQGETTKRTSLSSWEVIKGAENQERLLLTGGRISHQLTCSWERAIKERLVLVTGRLCHRGTCSRRPCMMVKKYR